LPQQSQNLPRKNYLTTSTPLILCPKCFEGNRVIKFTKLSGLGNDFICILDLEKAIKKPAELAKKVCNRRFGIGSDGLILVRKNSAGLLKMDYLNSDGSFAAMCGNGLRCFGKFVYDQGLVTSEKFTVSTDDGNKEIEVFGTKKQKSFQVKVQMGSPLYGKSYPPWENVWDYPILDDKFLLYLARVGVPHGVIFAPHGEKLVEKHGATIEKLNIFPAGINVNFVEVTAPDEITVFTWERGAGHTLACGTGCCACAFVAHQLGKVQKNIKVISEGGELHITLEHETIYMQATAQSIATGVYLD